MHIDSISIVVEPTTLPDDIPGQPPIPRRTFLQVDRLATELASLISAPVQVLETPLPAVSGEGVVILVSAGDIAQSLNACTPEAQVQLPSRTVLFAINRSEIFELLERYSFAAAVEKYPALIWRSDSAGKSPYLNGLHGLKSVAERMGAEINLVTGRYCLLRHDPFPGLPALLVEYLQHYQPEDLQRSP